MAHYLGIELGSTRIKAVLIDETSSIVAQGNHEWENSFENGLWTYSLVDVQDGLQAAYRELKAEYQRQKGDALTEIAGIGISAMMHGYLAFDKAGKLLVPFRTWRNTNTARASEMLSEIFHYNIPQRWSVAHLYQALLDREPHVPEVDFITTLAGYVHWQLTGEKAIGVGDAAGMFPISDETRDYDARMLEQFNGLAEVDFDLKALLPKVYLAGEKCGQLTDAGARLLDPDGDLRAGVPLCPPEGDAGTGMTATNTVQARTGNVSAGTSIFAMLVLEQALANYHAEIDMVTTPDGKPVAMVHCNNGTSEADAWVNIFSEFAALIGTETAKARIYELLYNAALDGDAGGLVAFNYLAGEPITETVEGRPLYARKPDSRLNLANFMLAQLFAIVATLKLGMDILTEEEQVTIDEITGHGGVFKTEGVMQSIMASALGIPTAVYRSAGEGGAWGIALLAQYSAAHSDLTLDQFLTDHVFGPSHERMVVEPDRVLAEKFTRYMDEFKQVLEVERSAIQHY